MKHLIILGDGMSDHPIARFGGKHLSNRLRLPILTVWPVKAVVDGL